jgi:leucyl/phenylalanyl-tRNA--protein transferase
MDFDRDFAAVVHACAARREHSPGTWITPEMHDAYCELHACGHAHSVEVRLGGELVGGLYGVLLGRVFFGESMFSRERDASKAALARLVERGVTAGLELIDCQLPTPHLRSLGSRPISRREFSALVASLAAGPDVPLFTAA